jgi:hypothetical protein
MKRVLITAAAFLLASSASFAQMEGPTSTQALVAVDSKSDQAPTINNVMLSVNGKKEQLTSWTQVPPSGAQIAVLIDDGLRESVGRELNSLRAFATSLPPGTELFIGYMRNGMVIPTAPFTTDHAAAAARFRLPLGTPGASASPYFSLSEFVKHWPSNRPAARFVLMITNGVDPYNGSTSIMNQNSPYVQAATEDAQRAGVSVSSIYFADAGFGGGGMGGGRRGRGGASFSGQSYLAQVSEGTGGFAYWQGMGNPVSMVPYLDAFKHSISETYVATFQAEAQGKKNDFVRIKAATDLHGVKLRTSDQVRVGNMESGPN